MISLSWSLTRLSQSRITSWVLRDWLEPRDCRFVLVHLSWKYGCIWSFLNCMILMDHITEIIESFKAYQACLYFLLKLPSVSAVVGEHRKGKSQSQPSIYMGGKLHFTMFLFHYSGQLKDIASHKTSYWCMIWCRIQLEEFHTCQEITWMNHSC